MNSFTPTKADRQIDGMSAAAQPPFTGDQARTLILGWTDLPMETRELLVADLERAAGICDVPLIGMVMSCAWLNEKFYARPPMAHGLERSTFSTIASRLRFVLERLGRHAPRDRSHDSLGGSWRALFDRLPDRFARAGLIELIRFCDRHDIAPEAVRSDTVETFEDWARHNLLRRGIRDLALGAEKIWNESRHSVPGWPQVDLRLPRIRGQFMLPLDALPPSFSEDLRRFEAELAGDRRARGARRADAAGDHSSAATHRRRTRVKPARQGTIDTRRNQILMAASALVHSGVPTEAVRDLRALVEPLDHADRIFDHFWTKAGNKPSSYTAGIGAVLKRIACVHCDPPSATAADISAWAREVTPEPQRGLSPKNRARLAAMIQPGNLRLLLNLPEELRLRALEPNRPANSAASLMMAAVAIEILLHCPLRLQNLHSLRLGHELRRLDPRSDLVSHLAIDEEATKNGQPIEWRVRPDTAALIDLWLSRFAVRPDHTAAEFLFPGRRKGCVSAGGLRRAIMAAIENTIGLVAHPHLFRHFAVWLHLQAHPGDYETARRLLGHSTVDTTIRFYAGLEVEAAARRHDDLVERERAAGRAFARAAFRRTRGRKPKGGRDA